MPVDDEVTAKSKSKMNDGKMATLHRKVTYEGVSSQPGCMVIYQLCQWQSVTVKWPAHHLQTVPHL
eukprot:scaffold181341_cov21-Prasinocladus_malaysianus.AAC.1